MSDIQVLSDYVPCRVTVLNVNNINSGDHLVCHEAFTEAKNHKLNYTLINEGKKKKKDGVTMNVLFLLRHGCQTQYYNLKIIYGSSGTSTALDLLNILRLIEKAGQNIRRWPV